MKDSFSKKFIYGLERNDIEIIRKIPKGDLHNHFSLGGNRDYIKKVTGIEIPYYKGILKSMNDMHNWNNKYLGERFN